MRHRCEVSVNRDDADMCRRAVIENDAAEVMRRRRGGLDRRACTVALAINPAAELTPTAASESACEAA